MDNHPIPQDITGFQFKLIGDMTIKQFAYLAGGIVLGWLAFATLPFVLIKVPVAGFFIVSGFAVAFFPIAGRPLDTMVTNYIKALFAPTQYVYRKIGTKIWFPEPHEVRAIHPSSSPHTGDEKLKAYLATLSPKPKNKYDERELSFFQSLSAHSFPQQAPTVQQQPKIITAIPVKRGLHEEKQNIPPMKTQMDQSVQESKPEEKKQSSPSEVLALKKKLQEAKLQEVVERGTAKYESAHKKVLELEKLLNEIQTRKLALENQLQELQKKLDMQNQNIMVPGVVKPKPESQTVKKIPLAMTKGAGIPITPEFPNLVSGVIKDPRGNPLPNILVEIKDNRGNPVRAFKTNIVGQFASATPLVNGVYALSFDDPKGLNKFDQVEINVTGEIMLPLEISSVDTREELRRSLFEQKN
ncbi:MAG: PrgI family protein [Candidatus Levybacteria bacterium]|nr:PrgI family protein [Candidatus Levybacteria bacterium]